MSKIETINEDILKIKEGVICHQVNCMGASGGLAGAIFRKYPEAQSEYKKTVQSFIDDWLPLGTVNLVEVTNKLCVANMFAQYDYGTDSRKTEYGTLRMCFRDLISAIMWRKDKKHLHNIYIPHGIGCGLGGGDWDIVKNIIKYEFSDWSFDIKICKKD